MKEMIQKELLAHQEVIQKVIQNLQEDILKASLAVTQAIRNQNTIFLCGNGGSAADCQHIAAEFTGRYKKERTPLGAIALTTDTSALTAIGNDYGFDNVFSRQLRAVAKKDDVLIAISTSGNSKNIIEAVLEAKEMGLTTIGLLGKDGGRVKDLVDICIVIPSNDTARIQEMHILIGHIIAQAGDDIF